MVGWQQEIPAGQEGCEPAPGAVRAAWPGTGLAKILARLGRYRAVRFGAVAATCTLGQLVILTGLTRLGLGKIPANGIGFVLSAQLNFALSAVITWRDRNPSRLRPACWASFNAVAAAALAVNEVVFALGTRAGLALLPAALAEIVASAAVTFTLNNLVTFRGPVAGPLERRPSLAEISGRAQRDGVAFFLPAYHEAANLRMIVPGIVGYFRELGCGRWARCATWPSSCSCWAPRCRCC